MLWSYFIQYSCYKYHSAFTTNKTAGRSILVVVRRPGDFKWPGARSVVIFTFDLSREMFLYTLSSICV